jgi:hypothetical protein
MDPAQPPVPQPPQAAAAQQPAQQPIIFPINFALVPGDYAGVIDYSTQQGLAIFSQASRSLFEDPADMFNVESAGLQTFLALLSLRGTTCGWDFDVPMDLTQPFQDLKDMITFHGQFHLEHIKDFA